MGWGTNLYCSIYYSRENFTTKSQVEDKIAENEKTIQNCMEDLKTLAMITEPKKFCEEDEDPICWISNKITDIRELYEDAVWDNSRLQLLLENWDECHTADGDPIHPPKDLADAYIDGDFILTKEEQRIYKETGML